jgi:hypothetical protein
MLTTAVAVLATVLAAVPARGGSVGPRLITFRAEAGDVRFPHGAHVEGMNEDCGACHGAGPPGKLSGFGQEAAHGLCIGCHRAGHEGPVRCAACHR